MSDRAQVQVTLAAGSADVGASVAYVVPHSWTDDGIRVAGGGTGAHLLLTAVGGCVLNDVYREAGSLSIDGVRVSASGDFDAATWATASISYDVQVDSSGGAAAVRELIERVERVAEIPRVVSGEVTVSRG